MSDQTKKQKPEPSEIRIDDLPAAEPTDAEESETKGGLSSSGFDLTGRPTTSFNPPTRA